MTREYKIATHAHILHNLRPLLYTYTHTCTHKMQIVRAKSLGDLHATYRDDVENDTDKTKPITHSKDASYHPPWIAYWLLFAILVLIFTGVMLYTVHQDARPVFEEGTTVLLPAEKTGWSGAMEIHWYRAGSAITFFVTMDAVCRFERCEYWFSDDMLPAKIRPTYTTTLVWVADDSLRVSSDGSNTKPEILITNGYLNMWTGWTQAKGNVLKLKGSVLKYIR